MIGPETARGQAFTLEGVIGALIVLASVVLALQAVDIAALSTDAEDSRTEQIETQVGDVLAAASDRGALRTAVTCVSSTGEPDPAVVNPNDPRTELGVLLNQTLTQTGGEFVVFVEYRDGDGLERNQLYPSGNISAPPGAVSVSRQVTLYDSDPVYRGETDGCVRDPDGTTVAEDNLFYIDRHPDADGVSNVYNTVRMKVIAW
jgi:hypothetical protein